ncbi:MAG: PD-(D/E)XK nuclease family protein, partial [Spirochaetales bacterium]|nr:PD-(D/E)XK nuclease family protein [Spirochaetales bacterium]
EWHGAPQEEVFAHAMKQIEQLDRALKACNRERLDGLYALFLSHLKRTQYVPRQQEEGIEVYRWPQGACIAGPYRFFLGLDQEGAEVLDDPYPFLSERVRQTLMKRKELGRYHLRAASLGNGILSCHRRSNGGEKLIHFYFLEEGTVREHEESMLLDRDPLSGELKRVLKKKGDQRPTHLQRRSFDRALSGSLAPRGSDHTRSFIEERLRRLPYEEDGRLRLSATGIDTFATCPYTYLARYLYKIDPFDYREIPVDNKAIGVLLHDIYGRFFTSIGPFDGERIESYEIGLQTAFDHALLKTYGTRGPTASIRQWIIHTYRPRILKILEEEKKYFEHLRTTDTEKELVWEGDRVVLDGRIDRIIEMGPMEWGVVDFKKGEGFNPVKFEHDEHVEHVVSYQLLVYQALIERNDLGNVVAAAYYFVEDGKYRFLYEQKDAKKQELCRIELDGMLDRILSAVRRGDFAATPGDKACSRCSFRALCRRRYSAP